MTIPFKGRWFYPPRPESVVAVGDMAFKSWAAEPDAVGQLKLNGTRNMIFVSPEREVRFWTRKRVKDLPSKYQPANTEPTDPVEQKYMIPDVMKRKLLAMAPNGHWTVFDTELLHFKTEHIKNTLYFYDVLVWESQHLIDVSYAKRYAIIQQLLGDAFVPLNEARTELQRCAALGQNNFFIAQNFQPDEWVNVWNRIQPYDFVEGLVLKRTAGVSRLELGHSVKNNSSWMCKLRKPHKNFRK